MKAFKHWPPKVRDKLRNQSRLDDGLRPDAVIILVDREGEEVLVEYKGKTVVSVIDCFDWHGFTVRSHHWVIDGIMHHSNVDPSMLDLGGGLDSYCFDDLRGNWESSEGGEGLWMV